MIQTNRTKVKTGSQIVRRKRYKEDWKDHFFEEEKITKTFKI
jgi:hypothetical protein